MAARREGWTSAFLRKETLAALKLYREDQTELQELKLEPIMRPNGSPGGDSKPPSVDAVLCRLLELVYMHREAAARRRGADRERRDGELPEGGMGYGRDGADPNE